MKDLATTKNFSGAFLLKKIRALDGKDINFINIVFLLLFINIFFNKKHALAV